MLVVTGVRSVVVEELRKLTDDPVLRIDAELSRPPGFLGEEEELNVPRIPHGDRYLLAAGVIQSKHILAQNASEMAETVSVNLINTIWICETVLRENPTARICVIGSESASYGSFDELYAASKAGVHAYVKFRATGWPQQLCCVSPCLISDAGMTRRRHDYPEVLQQRPTVTARDVALAVHDLLYGDPPLHYTNVVVEVTPQTVRARPRRMAG